MGRRKADLSDGDRLQTAVAVWRLAEALADLHATGELRGIAVEPDGHAGADDVVEDLNGVLRFWQVKRGTTPLDTSVLLSLADVLRASDRHEAVLAVQNPVPIKGLGGAECLQRLTELCRKPGSSGDSLRLSLYAEERKFFELFIEKCESPAAACETLGRLYVELLGSEHAVLQRATRALATVVPRERLESALAEVRREVADLSHGHQRMELPRVLTRLVGPNARALATRRAREEYLADVVSMMGRTRALDGLAGTAGLPRLADVWVARMVTWSRGETEPVPARGTLADVLMDPPSRLLRLTAGPGEGKTQALRWAALELAQRALAHPNEPVPVSLRARDLAAYPDRAGESHGAVERLAAQAIDVVLLIDGYDEVPLADRVAVSDRIVALSAKQAVRVAIVASRGNALSDTVPHAAPIQLVKWSHADSLSLLERWAVVDSDLAEEWRQSTYLRIVGSSPLVLTLALRSRMRPGFNRFELFEELASDLYVEWTLNRSGGDEAVERWEGVIQPLSRLALDMLRRGQRSVSKNVLVSMFRGWSSGARLAVDLSERMFGVLELTDNSQYQFSSVPISEYLAGIALSQEGAESILVAADDAEFAEVVRHSCGALYRYGRIEVLERVIEGLSQAVGRDFVGEMLVRPMGLRRLLAVARACADLQELPADHMQALAEMTFQYLVEESSCWVGDLVAEVAGELARTGGPLWNRLCPLACDALRDRRAWSWKAYDASGDEAPFEVWWSRCLHREAQVRAVAVSRLSALANDPDGRMLLMSLALDEEPAPFVEPVAFAVGRHLRDADRDEGFERILELLRGWLSSKNAQAACVAAIALRPGEGDLEKQLGVLRAFEPAHRDHLRPAVEWLASHAAGAEALERVWPEWTLLPVPSDKSLARDRTPPSSLPLTPVARRRVTTALGRAAGLTPVARSVLMEEARRGREHAVAAVLRRDDTPIEDVLSLLNACLPHELGSRNHREVGLHTAVDPSVQDCIGERAVRDPVLRDALCALWRRMEVGERWSFPGHALERAVRSGDEELTDIYADWVSHSASSIFRRHVRAYPADLLLKPRVKHSILSSFDDWVGVVEVPDDRGNYLDATGLKHGLRAWWPAWDERRVVGRLLAWLDDNRLAPCALGALARGTVRSAPREDLLAAVEAAVARLVQTPDLHSTFDCVRAIGYLANGPLAVDLQGLWLDLLEHEYGLYRLSGALALCASSNDPDVQEVAALAAEAWPSGALPFIDHDGFAPAVRCHPGAFVGRCRALFAELHPQALSLTRSIIEYLDGDTASDLLRYAVGIQEFASPVPWRRREDKKFEYARALDLLDEVRFELGLSLGVRT